jgi:hypothetical protein
MNDDDFDGPEGRPYDAPPEPPVEIPPGALSAAALAGVIEAFVLREGTDYGETETAHATKVGQVRRQLERGEIVIVYDPNTQSVTLVPAREWRAPGRPG